MIPRNFAVDYKGTQLYGDVLSTGSQTRILFLHGAGAADRSRYDYVRLPLAQDGTANASFDFIGHGETGGDLLTSSLRDRTSQVGAVISALSLSQPLGIVAGSMSAYTAIRLTQLYSIDRLVLLVPGIYHRDAYLLLFGKEFSEKIREPNSWQDSDAWEILGAFTGKLLILAAENDETIPKEVPQKIYDSAMNTSSRHLHIVKNAPHRIREFLIDPNNKEAFDRCYRLIKDILS